MRSLFFHLFRKAVLATALAWAGAACAEPRHGIAMYGQPALAPGFTALPYVNPDAPKGGTIRFGVAGGFDSLNPFILKGDAPYSVRAHVFESLMGRSWDEPFTLYGLLAESVETPEDRSWVEFTLRPEARFSDGTAVTVGDVIWSLRTLGEAGHPRYRNAWKKVAAVERTGPRSLRVSFNTPDRELPLIIGLRPILKKAQWQGRVFAESGMAPVPVGTGPYAIAEAEAGRQLILRRDPGYWGRDLPFMRGQANFDEMRYEYFGDGDVVFEAFRAGAIDIHREFNAAKWQRAYDFPAVKRGEVVKSLIPNERPSGMTGLVMNSRRAPFDDWRVRAAMITLFNFDQVNDTLTGGTAPRITSYFSNSMLGMRSGPAEGRVRALLAPFADDLPPGALEGYSLPEGSGRGIDRAALRRALGLLEQAGWTLDDTGTLRNAAGAAFAFDILLNQGATEAQQIVDIYVTALQQAGMRPRAVRVDSAQYIERRNVYDFDMTWYRRGLSLSPGNEQWLYWGSDGVTEPGTRNLMGMASPAAEAMIEALLTAQTHEGFVAAARALDRVLMAGRYVVPIWFSPVSRLAHKAWLRYPEELPIYGDWIGFLPDVWWSEE